MAHEDAPPAFNLLVETTGASTLLLPPPGWESTQHIVGSLTVDVHTRLPSTTSHATGPPLLTLHDVGQNAGTSFGPFLAFCRTQQTLSAHLAAASAHYHLTAAGHAPDAADLPAMQVVDVPGLVADVAQVLQRLAVGRAVGLGVGLGAGVLLRVAAVQPKAFAGLVLVSPVLLAGGFAERAAVAVDGVFARQLGLGLSRRAKERFLGRWLSEKAREENVGLVQSLEEGLDRLNAGNLVRLLAADCWRDDVSGQLKDVRARLLVVTGKESALRYHTEECFGLFDAGNVSWLDVADCGSLVHEERGDKVAEAFALLLEGLGGVR